MSAHGQILTCTNCGRENPEQAIYCSRCGGSLAGDTDPLIGKQVGKYVMEQRIGAGGSGTVYLGSHVHLGRRVAIKVLLPNLVTDDESKSRFEREAKVLAGLEHENVVTIIDVGYLEGVGPYMVMEWLEGLTLFEARRQRGFLELPEILPIMDQLTSAMSYIHLAGVVHRDLKPENMMLVSRGGQNSIDDLSSRLVKLYDFGIALFTAGDDRKLTAAGMVVGTPHYMAPEQIIVDAPVDYRADLYALGAILFELICGRPPFWGAKRPVEVMERHLRHDPPNLYELLPDRTFPHGLQSVIDRALAKKPGERFQDGRDMYDALEAAILGPSYVPFTVDHDEKTVVQTTSLWDVPERLDASTPHSSRDSQPVLPLAPLSSFGDTGVPDRMTGSGGLPFPPLGVGNDMLNTPTPNPSYAGPEHYPHPQSPPPPPSNPFLPVAHLSQAPTTHPPVAAPFAPPSSPSFPVAPGQMGLAHSGPISPISTPLPNPLVDSPTHPGHPTWDAAHKAGAVNDDTINVAKFGRKRWLFGFLTLFLGMLLIAAFFLWVR